MKTGLEGIIEKNNVQIKNPSQNIFQGMSLNIKNRDQETGWCYKNGGRPAYGYQIIHLDRGTNLKGRPVTKSIWQLHPENAKQARMIIIDLYLDQEMSYKRIRDYLNENNVPCPTGKPWTSPTIVEILRDNRLEQYAGIAYWNKENRHTRGRFNPKDKWIKVENAHPPIISLQELENLLYRKTRAQNNASIGKTTKSPYIFTGNNLEDQPMFVCAACGGNIIGYRSSSTNWKKYICGPSRYKGEAACPYKFMVNQEWLENTIVNAIDNRYSTPEHLNETARQVQEDLNAILKGYHDVLNNLARVEASLEKEQQILLDTVKTDYNTTDIDKVSNNLYSQINKIKSKITFLKSNPPRDLTNANSRIIRFSTPFSSTYANAAITERRILIRTFIKGLEMDPQKKVIRITFYPDSIVHTIGVE
jgi:ribosome-associated translation inhibitor RaiA